MSNSILPSPADLQDSLTDEELDVLQREYDKEEAKGYLSAQTQFNLAWGLVKCQGPHSKEQITRGVALLSKIYREVKERRRECLYYLALGHYKLGNYEQARMFNNQLMDKEPSNLQSQSLAELIEKAVSKEGLIGMAMVGGVAALATAAIISFTRNRR